jgi:hypothetical protein
MKRAKFAAEDELRQLKDTFGKLEETVTALKVRSEQPAGGDCDGGANKVCSVTQHGVKSKLPAVAWSVIQANSVYRITSLLKYMAWIHLRMYCRSLKSVLLGN